MQIIPWLWGSDSKQDDEVAVTNEQDQPATPENQEPVEVAVPNTDESPDSTAEIASRTTASADEDGHGLATEEEVDQPGETEEGNATLSTEDGIKRINEIKVAMFDMVTTVLGVFAPMFAMAIGIANVGECPANGFLPYMLFMMGVLGLCLSCYFIDKYIVGNFHSTREQNITSIVVSAALAFLGAIESKLLNSMDVSFDSSATNYCNFGFYIFTVVWNIFLLLVFISASFLLFGDLKNLNETRKARRAPHEWMTFESSDSDS